MLNRESILSVQDLATQDVDVPEWGGTVRVRMMTGTERDTLNASLAIKDGKGDMTDYRAKVVTLTLINDDGQRIFNLEDAPALSKKSSSALERVFVAAATLNGMLATSVDDAAKNSPAAPSGASS
jgi:hypothetical protein